MIGSGSAAEPDFSLALAKITRMSKEELNDLLNHEEKADDYIKSLDQVSKIFFESYVDVSFHDSSSSK